MDRWGMDTPGTPKPLNPELTGQPDGFVNDVFRRILRSDNLWQLADRAEAAHKRYQPEPTFNVQAYADAMGLTIVRRLA